MIAKDELKVHVAQEVIKVGRGDVSPELYKAAEKVLTDFLLSPATAKVER